MLKMKERPILFNAEMVKAVLDGRKTQARFICKEANDGGSIMRGPAQFVHPCLDGTWIAWWSPRIVTFEESQALYPGGGFKCPFGTVGDMPRWAPRVTLEITGVRVERLNDISEADAAAEGVTLIESELETYYSGFKSLWESISGRPKLPQNESSKRYARVKRWLDRNPDYSWAANPWVWVVEFRKVEA
jgi:hypothetical protein